MREKVRLLGFLLLLLGYTLQPVFASSKQSLGVPPPNPVKGGHQYIAYLPGVSGTNALTIPSTSSKITSYPFTVEMWVRPNAITAYGGFFYDKNGASGTNKTCLQFANATTGEMRFDLFGTATAVPLTAAAKLVVGKWQHLAIVVRQDSAIVEIDGNYYAAANTKAFTSLGVTTSTLGLDADAAARTFNGSIDEVRIWKSARTRTEIKTYKDSVINPANAADLVAYYNFNDGTVNDATTNALNLTKGTSVVLSDANSDVRIASMTASGGFFTPSSFNPDSLSYNYYAPQGASVSFAAVHDSMTISPNPAMPTVANPNVSVIATSKDGSSSKTYTINTTFMPFSSWKAEGKTGAGTEPGNWGWSINNTTTGWGIVGGSANRLVDIAANWNYNNGTSTSAWTGRLLYIRWDGTGATNTSSIYSYPMYLEGCKTYDLSFKYAWVNNGSAPAINLAVSDNRLGTNPIYTDQAVVTGTTKQLLFGKKMVFSPTTTGVYYVTFGIANNNATLAAVADFVLGESTTKAINSTVSTIALNNNNSSQKFRVTGIALTDTIKINAPAGLNVSVPHILAADATCGVDVTVSLGKNASFTNDSIMLVSGSVSKKIALSYTKPSIGIYEQNVEVENDGKVYPLYLSSVNNTIDTLYIAPSAGITVSKTMLLASDFVAGTASVGVSSNVAGTTGSILFMDRNNNPMDTINVAAVAPYQRMYIKHKNAGLVIGNLTTGPNPALTVAKGLISQKFIIRRAVPGSLTDTSFYLVQDTAYRVMRKTPSSAWDTEFGIPSNEAKWTIQQKGNGAVTLTNVVTGKVLGTDATAANGRMYDDKVWTAGGNQEWQILPIPVLTVSASTVPDYAANYGTPSKQTIKIGGKGLSSTIKLSLSGTGASSFALSYDSLVVANNEAADSVLTISYLGNALGTQTAALTIKTNLNPDVIITLKGNTVKDMTSSIVNSTIEATSNTAIPTGWSITKNTGNVTGTGQHYSGVATNRYFDSWHATVGYLIYNAQQTVKSIPNGIYKVAAVGRSSGSKAYIFANSKQTEIINNADKNGALGKGWNPVIVDSVAVLDSTITIGAKTVTGWTGTWFSADEFKLTYYGEGTQAAYKVVLDSLVAKAKRFDLATTPNGQDALLLKAISDAEAASNVGATLSAYTALKAALDNSTAAVSAYANLKTAIDNATTLSNTTAYTGLDEFKAAISTADAAYKAETTLPSDVATAATALNLALRSYKIHQPAPADFTFILANPSFEEGTVAGIDKSSFAKYGSLNSPIGWNAYARVDSVTSGNINMVGITSNVADGSKAFETWATSGSIREINISQKIVAPVSGYYILSAKLRCDGSSPSSTDPLKYDGHIYAKVGTAAEVASLKLAETPGLITSTGWNTQAAWRTMTLTFKANVGDTIKLGAASGSFMQMDNFTLGFKGDNNPDKLDIAYITKAKSMDASADSVQNDPIYRVLSKDTKVSLKLVTMSDVSTSASFNQAAYDAMIVQGSFDGSEGLFKPEGALALSKLSIPTLMNVNGALVAGNALAEGSTGEFANVGGVLSLNVLTANQTNKLFKAIAFAGDSAQLFNSAATEDGVVSTTGKALNLVNNVTGTEGTLIGQPTYSAPAIGTNYIVAPDTIGGQAVKTKLILFGQNFGALCAQHGENITTANYTLWRNAAYDLVGLTIPETPVNVSFIKVVEGAVLPEFATEFGTSSEKTIKLSRKGLTPDGVTVTVTGTGAAAFSVHPATITSVNAVYPDTTYVVSYLGNAYGVQKANLVISAPNSESVIIALKGTTTLDQTSKIVNPTVEATSNTAIPNGWTVTKNTGNVSGTGQHYSGVATNRYFDSWHGTAGFLIYNAQQTVKALPNGIYKLVAAGRSSGSKAYIFANDKQTEIINNADKDGALGKGWNPVTVDSIAVLDSTITIGAKTVTGWTGTWFSADDFKLTYYGPGSYTAYKVVLDSLVSKAKRFDLTTTPNGIDAQLLTAVTNAQSASDVNSVLSSYAALKATIDNANASVTAYSNFKALITSAATLSTTTNYKGLATLVAAIATANDVYNGAATMPLDVTNATTALNAVLKAYKLTQPAPADFTFVLANPGFEEGTTAGIDKTSFAKYGSLNTPIGWNAYARVDSVASGNINMVGFSGATVAEGSKAFETWATGGSIREFNISQKLVAPVKGYYVLSAKLRCDGSSPSLTDPAKYDGHIYAKVGTQSILSSKKLAETAGLITGSGWNTKDAWRTMTLAFNANAGDTIQLGAASTSFMQMDNFTLSFRGENNPATIDIAYITKAKTMDGNASPVTSDPVYSMLAKDSLMHVKLIVLSDVSTSAEFDQSLFDAMVIQGSIDANDGILKPVGALGLSKLTIPTLLNVNGALVAGNALGAEATGTYSEAPLATFSMTVSTANQANKLFKGLTFEKDSIQLFYKGASDNGAILQNGVEGTLTTYKALNLVSGVTGVEGTLLGAPTGTNPAIALNYISAPDTIGDQAVKTKLILFNQSFGAICSNMGTHMTDANMTLWRNAIYDLAGLAIPSNPYVSVNHDPTVDKLAIRAYPNPTSNYINIENLDVNSVVRIFNMTGQQVYTGRVEGNVTTVDMSHFSNGMYMLKVVTNGKNVNTKILKK